MPAASLRPVAAAAVLPQRMRSRSALYDCAGRQHAIPAAMFAVAFGEFSPPACTQAATAGAGLNLPAAGQGPHPLNAAVAPQQLPVTMPWPGSHARDPWQGSCCVCPCVSVVQVLGISAQDYNDTAYRDWET